jgi:hypothetical protein
MVMTPWIVMENIEVAKSMADDNGFKLDTHPNYRGNICLMTKGNNEHGFVNDIALHVFDDWPDVITFMAGWNKAMLAVELVKTVKGKKK